VSTAVSADVCRVVLVAPHRTLEVALPQTVPLADLIPVLVQRVTVPGVPGRRGHRNPRMGLTGDGDWVLQRLGGVPLEEELTPAALQILDGETLHLRPRDAQLPPAHFDDLIDGLATGIRSRADRWRPSMTRGLFLTVCAFTLAICFVLLLDPELPGRAAVAGAVALMLVLGAAMCSRGLADGWAAGTLGVAAVPFAALAGFLVPARPGGAETAAALPAANLLSAAAAASLVVLLVVFAVGQYRAVFLAIWLTGAAGVFGGLLAVLGLSAAQAAGTVVASVLIAGTFTPQISFRLARMRLPQLPTSAADLADDIEPYPAPQVMAGAVAADTYLTWLSIAVGVVCCAGVMVVVPDGRWSALGLVIAVSLVLTVRSRGMTSAWQRASALAPALLGWALVIVHLADRSDAQGRLVAVTGLIFTAGFMLAFSRIMPGRRLLPHWGRLVDIFEYVFAIAVVLLLLAIFDAYQWARAMAG
jgi:type VII secretion integral membrane protein EccD